MTRSEFAALAEAVQVNCHIADARHAADLSMCIYLLQMREFYRWEQGIGPLQSLPHDQLGAWLAGREALWQSLEGRDYEPLSIAGQALEPFDMVGINSRLQGQGLVYGAGLVGPGRASFFLGELHSAQQRDAARLVVSGRERARGLSAPPAVLAGSTIYLRQDALERWLWQKFESWTLKEPRGAFRSALDCYGYEPDGRVALERMARAQGETLVLHELGELTAGELLGPRWHEMRAGLACRRTELYLRCVRDHLADCLVTLPRLLEQGATESIHFWFSNFEGLRAETFPELARAYGCWCAGDAGQELMRVVATGRSHWLDMGTQALRLFAKLGADASPAIRRLLESAPGRQ